MVFKGGIDRVGKHKRTATFKQTPSSGEILHYKFDLPMGNWKRKSQQVITPEEVPLTNQF